MRPNIPNAFCVGVVLFCGSCWRLACFLWFLAMLALVFWFFLLCPLFLFGCLASESGVKEYLEHLHSNHSGRVVKAPEWRQATGDAEWARIAISGEFYSKGGKRDPWN